MSMTNRGKAIEADINVTPLIDVLLVLLIVFMVIAPTAVRGLDALITQPPKSPDQAELDRQPIVVEVLGDNQRGISYKINSASLSRAGIEHRLAEIFATRSDKTIFIKGDGNLDFSSVADVINSGHQAGVDNIAILTPQASRSQ